MAAKFFSSSNNEDQEAPWLQNPWRKDAVAFTENVMNQGNFVSGHNMHVTTIMTTFASLVMTLKIILIYVQECEKRTPTQILKDMRVIRSGISNFVIFNRYSFYRALTLNLDRKYSVETSVKL